MSTYQIQVAQNVCGERPPCSSYIAPVEGALTCTPIGDITVGGFPRAGGRIQFQLWSDPCPPSTQPSLNICFNSGIQLPLCAAQPDYGYEYNPTKWITGYAYFGSRVSADGTSAQFRASGELTVNTQSQIQVKVLIEFLTTNGTNNVWQPWISWNMPYNIQGAYAKIQSINYRSSPEYFHVTPSGDGPCCEVSWVSSFAGIEPLLYGCGPSRGEYDTCGLWNGDYFYTCFRGEIFDKSNNLYPIPFLMALNSSTCGGVGFGVCGCDVCDLVTTSPVTFDCKYNADPSFADYVYTGYESAGDKQEIQIGHQTYPLIIMIKEINQSQLWFYWKDLSVPTPVWTRSAGTLVQAYGPTIYTVEDANWKIVFYATRYPSPEIVPDCTASIPYQALPPEEGEGVMNQFNIIGQPIPTVEENNNRAKLLTKIKLVMTNPCKHIGDLIEQQNGCSCSQSPKYKCDLYGGCYKYSSRGDNVKTCATCDSYEPLN